MEICFDMEYLSIDSKYKTIIEKPGKTNANAEEMTGGDVMEQALDLALAIVDAEYDGKDEADGKDVDDGDDDADDGEDGEEDDGDDGDDDEDDGEEDDEDDGDDAERENDKEDQ